MTRYIVKRVLLAIASVFIICAITFFAMNAIPGGPFNSEKALSEATKQVLEQRYNLDKPVPVQFVLYLKNLMHGDFGVSLKTGRDIGGTLMECFKVSGRLGLTAAVLAVISGSTVQKRTDRSYHRLLHNSVHRNAFLCVCNLPDAGVLHHAEMAAGMGRIEQVADPTGHRAGGLSHGLRHAPYQNIDA